MQRNVISTVFFKRAANFALCLSAICLLNACEATQSPWETAPIKRETPAPTLPPQPAPAPVMPTSAVSGKSKIALLVPMSGKGSDAGQAMLNAAQLAMFDLGGDSVELMPHDTNGTPDTARDAARLAGTDGAKIILGPLFAQDAKSVSPIAAQSGLNIVSFSTDTSAAGPNTFILGFLPQSQVTRIIQYAGSKGLMHIALIAPHDAFGDTVANSFTSLLTQNNLMNSGTLRYDGAQPTPDQLAQFLVAHNFDAVLIAANAANASTIAQTIKIKSSTAQILGTGLWDQADAEKYPSLNGAWYAASSPAQRLKFESKYRDTYGENPPRIASLAYDAAALAVVLTKQGQGFDRAALMNPNGFAGIDGIFRFLSNGQNERGLAVLQIGAGQPVIIEDAPRSFR